MFESHQVRLTLRARFGACTMNDSLASGLETMQELAKGCGTAPSKAVTMNGTPNKLVAPTLPPNRLL